MLWDRSTLATFSEYNFLMAVDNWKSTHLQTGTVRDLPCSRTEASESSPVTTQNNPNRGAPSAFRTRRPSMSTIWDRTQPSCTVRRLYPVFDRPRHAGGLHVTMNAWGCTYIAHSEIYEPSTSSGPKPEPYSSNQLRQGAPAPLQYQDWATDRHTCMHYSSRTLAPAAVSG